MIGLAIAAKITIAVVVVVVGRSGDGRHCAPVVCPKMVYQERSEYASLY